ncbi:hypothetical protein H1P_20029 [Hyella patelloides LEGE 07179]|uniref:YD repeat protein n=1 Tax=Hyella patelloides LEGE 07179 TaxID=945734 RepID=A0A563VPN2_9CYAN|nr:hypothetical protein H1P_20029 [Hyella patelloides LEGE 07179]
MKLVIPTLWGLTDRQSTIRDVIDSNGNFLNHISYDSFGNIINQTDSNINFRILNFLQLFL